MRTKLITAAAALALSAGAQAQTQTTTTTDLEVRELNKNVTKVDGTVNGATVKGMTNPVQTRVRVADPELGRVNLRVKPGDGTDLPDLTDIDVTVRELNDNVTRVDGTVDDVKVKGMTNPAQTRVKVRAPDGGKADLQVKPPK